jgi:myo-inositol-1(or 4)-monophosphatase
MQERPDYSAAIEVVRELGETLRKQFGKAQPVRNKGELAVDVVTSLDTEVEQLLITRLKEAYPDIGFEGEEFGVTQAAERIWLVDPIDGTAHFVRGIPFCTTMVALVDGGEVVFSVIYDFVRDDVYVAEKHRGARLNGELIRVSDRSLSNAYVAVEANLDRAENVAAYVSLRKRCIVMETINCGFEFCLVATGKIEGRICMDPFGHDWDFAAGSLLVAEAGGVVANIGRSAYAYRDHNFLATNRAVYAQLTTGANPLFPIAKS